MTKSKPTAPALPGPAELQRIRLRYGDRGTEMDIAATAMGDKDAAHRMNEANHLCFKIYEHLARIICSTPAEDVDDALAVTDCVIALFDNLTASIHPEGERVALERNIKNGLSVLSECLRKQGADGALADDLGTWYRNRMIAIHLAHNSEPFEEEAGQ